MAPGRPLPLKHSKTCDSFNEKYRLVLQNDQHLGISVSPAPVHLWVRRTWRSEEKQDLAAQVGPESLELKVNKACRNYWG